MTILLCISVFSDCHAELIETYGHQCSLVSELKISEPKVQSMILVSEDQRKRVVVFFFFVVFLFGFIGLFYFYSLPLSDQLYALLKQHKFNV